MAIARTQLIAATASASPIVGGTSTTASVTNTANALLLLSISFGDAGGAPAKPTSVSGLGLTWTEVNSATVGNIGCIVYKALGASSTGALTINWAAGTDSGLWALEEYTGVDPVTPVVQSNTSAANTTNPTLTLSATPGVKSWTHGAMAKNSTTQTVAAGTNFVKNTEQTNTSPSQRLALETNSNASPSTTVNWTTSGAANTALVGLEIGVNVHVATASFSGTGSFAATGNAYTQGIPQWARLTGSAGALNTPDAAAWDISGDIDMRMRLSLDVWNPAWTVDLIGKHGITNQDSYGFRVSSKTLGFLYSTDGINDVTRTATTTLTVADGAVIWVGVTVDVDNGSTQNVIKFYTYTGETAPADITTWTQVGSTVTSAGVISFFNSTTYPALGARGYSSPGTGSASTSGSGVNGKIYNAQVRTGINGTLVGNFDATNDGWRMGEVATRGIADSAGKTWTLRGTATIDGVTPVLGTASFSGTGSFDATGVRTHLPTATFSGTGSFAATGVRTAVATGSFSGVGSFAAAAPTLLYLASGSFTGVGSFAVTTSRTWSAHAAPEAFVYIETTADTWVDISADLISGSTDRGRTNELDRYKTGTATLVFKNLDRKYDPVNADGPLYGYLDVRHRMRVEAFQNDITYPVFFGYIDEISENRSLSNTHATATIKLSDFFKVLNKAAVNGTDFASQLPGARIEDVLDLVDLDVALRNIDTGATTLQAMTDVSSTLLSHLQTVAQTEFGDFFVQADGVVRFKERSAALDEEIQATFGEAPTEIHYNSLTPQYNDTLIRNPVSVDRVGGTKQTVEDTALTALPPAGYGKNHFTLSGTYHNSDADALAAAQYLLARYKSPARRVVGLGFGPVPFLEGPTVYPQILGRELTERIEVVERPLGLGSEIRNGAVIEGVHHDFSPGKWQTKWNVSPGFVSGDFWILGESELGTETVLYF